VHGRRARHPRHVRPLQDQVAGTLKSLLLAGAAALALAVAFGSAQARGTTGPDPYVILNVTVTDSRIVITSADAKDRHPLVQSVEVIAFRIRDRGKRTHNFVIGGRKSPLVKPGQLVHMIVAFPAEGEYLFTCTVNCKRTMRGHLRIVPKP
jgi:hypothetical protein